MSRKAYCVCTDKGWCSVLGDFYPNLQPSATPDTVEHQKVRHSQARYQGGVFNIQRLCDQHNVSYEQVWWREPTCVECKSIRDFIEGSDIANVGK